MSKRVQVLTWFLVFMMLFICACTAAKTRRTGERNTGGAYKPECEAASTLPLTTNSNYTASITIPTYSFNNTGTLETFVEMSKICIGMHIDAVSDYVLDSFGITQYESTDEYDYAPPYPHARIINGFDESVLIEGVAFNKISLLADKNDIVREIEFDVREHGLVYSPEEYENASDLYLPVDKYSQSLDSKMQRIYGKPTNENDVSWIGSGDGGWYAWVDGAYEFDLFWAENCVGFAGNNTLSFGICVVEDDTDGPGYLNDKYKDFALEMNSVLGLTESDALAKLEAFLGTSLGSADIIEDDGFNLKKLTYEIPVSVGDVAFDSFQIHIENETNIVVYIRFYTDSVSFNEAQNFYFLFVTNIDTFTDGMLHENIYDESEWEINLRAYPMDNNHCMVITRKTYISDNSDNIFTVEFSI